MSVSTAAYADGHLHLALIDQERPGEAARVLKESRAQGIRFFLTAGADLESSRSEVQALETYGKGVWTVVGIHPWWANTFNPAAILELRRLLDTPGVVGVGEVGLDFVRGQHPRDLQVKVFSAMLDLAQESGVPIVLHGDRLDEATHREAVAIVRSRAGVTGFVHGFDARFEVAREWLDVGFALSFSGVVTWPGKEELRSVAAQMPLDRLLAETDTPAPYQPVESRDKPNHPAYVRSVVEELARLRRMDAAELAHQLFANLNHAFPRLAGAATLV